MVVVLTIKEMSYLVVGLILQFGVPPLVFIFVILSSLAALLGLIPP